MINPLDPVIARFRLISDAIRVAIRIIEAGAGKSITDHSKVVAGSLQPTDFVPLASWAILSKHAAIHGVADAGDQLRNVAAELERLVVVELAAVFEITLRKHLTRAATTWIPASTKDQSAFQEIVTKEVEWWNYKEILIDLFPSVDAVDPNLRGMAKQIVEAPELGRARKAHRPDREGTNESFSRRCVSPAHGVPDSRRYRDLTLGFTNSSVKTRSKSPTPTRIASCRNSIGVSMKCVGAASSGRPTSGTRNPRYRRTCGGAKFAGPLAKRAAARPGPEQRGDHGRFSASLPLKGTDMQDIRDNLTADVPGVSLGMPPVDTGRRVDGTYADTSYYWDDKRGPGPRIMAADTLEGDDVRNDADEKLGKLAHIMLDVPTGRVAYGVLSVGGFLGLGDKLFAIPWSGAAARHGEPRLPAEPLQGTAERRTRVRPGRVAVDGRPAVGHGHPQVLQRATVLGTSR